VRGSGRPSRRRRRVNRHLRRDGIYGITDTSYTVKSHVEAARAFLEGGVRIVQYRRKEGSIRVMLEEARETRNLHPTGFKLVIVHRPEDVDKVDPTKEAIVIGRTVGLRKRVEIVRRAIERGVRVINVTKDVIDELSRSQ